MSRIQLYILRQSMRYLAVVTGVTVLAILIVDTVEQLNTIGSRVNLGLLQAMSLSLMKLPTLIEQTLAFTLLISTMLTFRQLSRTSELSVIRASGLSAWRFLTPTVLLALALGFLTMMIISPIGSNLTKRFEAIRSQLVEPGHSQISAIETGIWLRDGDDENQTIIHAQEIDETGTLLSDVVILQEQRSTIEAASDTPFTFTRRLEASQAKLDQGFWKLEEVTEYRPNRPIQVRATLQLPTDLEHDTLIDRFSTPTAIGFWTLPDFIKRSRAIGINVSKYEIRWLSLMTLPVLFTAMSLMGALACLRLARLGGTAPYVAFGAVGAVSLYAVIQLGSSLGTIGAVPPAIAAWTPPVFAVLACLALVAINEDG